MRPKVFLSSTVYDLIDLRAEASQHISDLGLSPSLSDSAVSEFSVVADENSIETCLANVKSSDFFVLVLSRRYGPSLGKIGYDDISATHLEYRHAVEHSVPVLFYVRDKLEAEYRIWTKNKGTDVDFRWVSDKDAGLFDLIEEHRKLVDKRNRSNWYFTFSNCRDLKGSLTTHLGGIARRAGLEKQIAENLVPAFSCSSEASVSDGQTKVVLTCHMKNVGLRPAFNVLAHWDEQNERESLGPVVAPGDELLMSFVLRGGPPWQDCGRLLSVEYLTAEGNHVYDKLSVRFSREPDGGYAHGVTLISKTYKVGAESPVQTLIDSD